MFSRHTRQACVIALFVFTLSSFSAEGNEFFQNEQCSALLVDTGVLASGGCLSLLSGRASPDCCDIGARVVSDVCVALAIPYLDDALVTSHFLLKSIEACHLVPAVGYDTRGCSDGVVTGEEQCDDGNAISGDGCSSYCFVEDGFDCFSDKNGTSVCWKCEEECFVQNRGVCLSPGGSCGDCIAGFEENDLGFCAALKHVYYAAITEYGGLNSPKCVYHDVGTVLEGSPHKSSELYLDAIRMWQGDRSELRENVSCSLSDAIEGFPRGENVVVVELFLPEVRVSNVTIGTPSESLHLVIFSDAHKYPRLDAERQWAFAVYLGSALYLHGIHITNCSWKRGAVLTSYGITVFEDVVVSNCLAKPNLAFLLLDDMTGILVSTYGYLRWVDVTVGWTLRFRITICL
eukprot:Rmarinus@m.11415